ncbi:hypothetical protein ACWCQW_53780 [Streptomyces mirabilis]
MPRRQAALPADRELDTMMDCYQKLDRTAELALFHTRLSLSVIDIADGVEESIAHRVAADLIHQTATSGDGYAARDVLAHPGCSTRLTGRQAQQLGHAVEACALGQGGIPAELRADVMAALDTSERVLRRTLAAAQQAPALLGQEGGRPCWSGTDPDDAVGQQTTVFR